MKRLTSTLILAGLLMAGTAFGGEEAMLHPKQKVLEGHIIDLGCYVMGMSGGEHAECGKQCALKGLPVGLLVQKTERLPHSPQERKVEESYMILLPSIALAPYMERTVRITGKVYKKNLLVPGKMEVREGEAWKAVELPSAM